MPISAFSSCLDCAVRHQTPLKDLPEDILKDFSACKTANLYKRGQIIFYEGNRPFGIYCVTQGKIKLSKTTPDGKSYIVKIAKDGDLLGYRSFFTHEKYTATAEALEDATICFLDRSLFMDALRRYPQFALDILERMGQELKCAEEKARDLAYKSAQERMVEMLLTLKETYGEAQGDGSYRLQITLTREELANMLGITTETAVRNLTWLKEKGLISFDRKVMQLLDPERMQRLLPYY